VSLRDLYKNIMNDHTSSDGVQTALQEMRQNAKKNCKRCYGRGYLGRDTITGVYVPCNCVIRNIQKEKV